MAHKKGVGSTDNGRDSNSKRLGVKLYGGELAIAGNIIVRQRGTKFHAGQNVGMGKDHTLYALTDGIVRFRKRRKDRTYISIAPMDIDMIEANGEERKVVAKAEKPKAEKPKAEKPKEDKPKAKQAPKAEQPKPEPVKEEKPKAKAPEKKKEEKAPADESEAKSNLLSSIGEASADEKDDLKKIKGIGPKLEETLNGMGIYTFAQVAKMTDKEYDLVDSLMDSFKGRGKRDDWAGQAKELMG